MLTANLLVNSLAIGVSAANAAVLAFCGSEPFIPNLVSADLYQPHQFLPDPRMVGSVQ